MPRKTDIAKFLSMAGAWAPLISTLALVVASSLAFSRIGHAGDRRIHLCISESEMAETCTGALERPLRSMAQRGKTRKSGANSANERGAVARKRAIRRAEEAARREAERETQRKLDQIILEQLLRDAGRR